MAGKSAREMVPHVPAAAAMRGLTPGQAWPQPTAPAARWRLVGDALRRVGHLRGAIPQRASAGELA